MIIEYEGQRHEFDFDEITVKQAIKIEKHTGLTLTEWGKALTEGGSAIAIQAFGWLVLAGGRDSAIDDCDFKMGKLGEAFAKAAEEEDAAEKAREAAEAAGPTVPASPPNGSGGGSIPALSLPSPPTG